MSMTHGNWLVRYDEASKKTLYSNNATALRSSDDDDEFNTQLVANKLAKSLHYGPHEIESWALKNVQPGYVVEESWTAHNNDDAPLHEFNIFTIWGRVWVGQWNAVYGQNRYNDGFINCPNGWTGMR